MAITILSKNYQSFGSQSGAIGQLQLDASYPTGGYSLPATQFSLSVLNSMQLSTVNGDLLAYNYSTQKLMAFTAAGGAGGSTGATSGGTPTGTNGTSAVTGTGAGTVTPTGSTLSSAINMAFPQFTGVGLTAVGQVITTTDNQTMGVDQCAGMWLISATGSTPPNLILSNTAVTGAPAVFTVQGAALTDAGAYQVVNNAGPAFVGAPSAVTVSSLSGTAAAQVFTGDPLGTHTHTVAAGAGGLVEVANATDLSSVVANYIAMGN